MLALAEAVNASKSVIVAANGWTGPAETKAEFCNMDLLLLSIDEALDLGCVDELFNHQPYGCEMQECEKALAQFVIARSNTAKLL